MTLYFLQRRLGEFQLADRDHLDLLIQRQFTVDQVNLSLQRFQDLIGCHVRALFLIRVPKGFHIPTPVGNYSPDWAIAFNDGSVKHIYFIAETKGTMDSLELRPIEQAKIACAKKLFNEISTSNVRYHDVDSYQSLLTIMNKL